MNGVTTILAVVQSRVSTRLEIWLLTSPSSRNRFGPRSRGGGQTARDRHRGVLIEEPSAFPRLSAPLWNSARMRTTWPSGSRSHAAPSWDQLQAKWPRF